MSQKEGWFRLTNRISKEKALGETPGAFVFSFRK